MEGPLTSYNGRTITYDKQGNPRTYRGHSTLFWEKWRQLKLLYTTDGAKLEFAYNANGIRTSKTVGSVKHIYILDGTKILSESLVNGGSRHTIYTHYDNEGSICGINYDGQGYYFLKNQQGDIIAITDKDGEVVARYRYDAWGVCTIVSDITQCDIANVNPFRYRGYYYDRETGLYYLQSRYYDPETGRFVNADEASLLFVSDIILSENYYAYCDNNPINNIDKSGERCVPKYIAYGFQLEISIPFGEYGVEVVFSKGKAYLFFYGGLGYGNTLSNMLDELKFNFAGIFTKKNFAKNIKRLFTGSVSLCVFAIFSSRIKTFDPKSYKGPFVGVSTTIPTPYPVAVKSYVSTWTVYTCVGLGFAYPCCFDVSYSYTQYIYRGNWNFSATIQNFVNKQSKGLKP